MNCPPYRTRYQNNHEEGYLSVYREGPQEQPNIVRWLSAPALSVCNGWGPKLKQRVYEHRHE
ncbi:hypothetical protein GCM10009712_20620 [Pseudarthrobacter sulfonivorans]